MDLFIRNEMLRIFQTITFSSFMLHNAPITATIKVLKPFFPRLLNDIQWINFFVSKVHSDMLLAYFQKGRNF